MIDHDDDDAAADAGSGRAPSHRGWTHVPPPTAPYGTLLEAVQLAHWHTRGSPAGHHEQRIRVMRYARTHAGLLLGTPVSEHQRGFVMRSTSPWDVLATWIEAALKPTPAGKGVA